METYYDEPFTIAGWVATCVRDDLPPSVYGPFTTEEHAIEEIAELTASGCEGVHRIVALETPFTREAATSLTVTDLNSEA